MSVQIFMTATEAVLPIVLLILLGVFPQPVLDTSAASMQGVQQWLSGALNPLASGQ